MRNKRAHQPDNDPLLMIQCRRCKAPESWLYRDRTVEIASNGRMMRIGCKCCGDNVFIPTRDPAALTVLLP